MYSKLKPEEQYKIDYLRAYKGQYWWIVLYTTSKYTDMNMKVIAQMNCQTVVASTLARAFEFVHNSSIRFTLGYHAPGLQTADMETIVDIADILIKRLLIS